MTPQQTQHLESALEKRGYKLYTNCLVSNETRAWFKSFGVHTDEYGNRDNDYQIAFRIYDWRNKYPNFNPPEQSHGLP